MKIVKTFQPKIVIFTAVKNRCMLHGRVFEMGTFGGWLPLHNFEPIPQCATGGQIIGNLLKTIFNFSVM